MNIPNTRFSKLLKGTFIYAIGNIGSKLIMVLMLPLYTFFLSKEDFGFYDLSMTLIFLSITLVTLDLKDGVFRFLLNQQNEENYKLVISSSFTVIFTLSVFVSVLSLLAQQIYPIKYYPYLLLTLLSYCVYEVEVQSLRGIAKTSVFVVANLISAFVACSLCYFLIRYYGLGLRAFYIANIVSRLLSMIYVELKLKFFLHFFSLKNLQKKFVKKILRYTIPLIPSVVCWWLIGSSSRILISKLLGFQDNGIFAIAMRFSDILFMISSIFYQSWQETAINEYYSSDRDTFFSKVFNQYFFVLSFLVISIALFTKSFFVFFIGSQYLESLLYIYPLMVSVIFTAMSAFLDLGYQCSFQSSRSIPSMVSTTIINVVLNYWMIEHYQLLGASIAAILTYLYLFVYRILDTRRFFTLHINPIVYFSIASLVVGGLMYYLIDNKIVLTLLGCLSLLPILSLVWQSILSHFLKSN